MVWRKDQPYCSEWAKNSFLWELVPFTRGRGLDLGCGSEKAFPHFIGVDNLKDEELFGRKVRPDVVADVCDLSMFADGSMDFIFSSHTLEHVWDWKLALRLWWSKIKEGGHLVLLLPHKDLYPNVGQEWANPDHKHDFLPEDIKDHMKKLGSWEMHRNEVRDQGDEYSFYQVYKKMPSGSGHSYPCSAPSIPKEKRVGIVRYGAWGDGLQASSVLPELKAQGFHVTFYTTPRCYEAIKHDPNVDSWYLQDKDQVPNNFLDQFWAYEAEKYARFINLSETVEYAWLTIWDSKGIKQSWHSRPHSVRAKYLNANYIEFAHDCAEVPYVKPNVKFYPTLEERNWAHEQREQIGGDPLILWVLAGSSVHKVWPHIDQVLARLFLEYPNVRVVTVGDARCKQIEENPGTTEGSFDWRGEPRIVRRSGEWSIRHTLAFAQLCNVVIGPETGVLSAVSMEKMPKVVFLSHSSHENLTRDWENTYALFSTKTSCYPCHRLHFGWEFCNPNKELGVAQCQADIPADACWMALERALNKAVLRVA